MALFTTSMTFDIRICVPTFPSIRAGYRRQLIQFHLLQSPVLSQMISFRQFSFTLCLSMVCPLLLMDGLPCSSFMIVVLSFIYFIAE